MARMWAGNYGGFLNGWTRPMRAHMHPPVLEMDPALVAQAIHALSVECRRLKPGTR